MSDSGASICLTAWPTIGWASTNRTTNVSRDAMIPAAGSGEEPLMDMRACLLLKITPRSIAVEIGILRYSPPTHAIRDDVDSAIQRHFGLPKRSPHRQCPR